MRLSVIIPTYGRRADLLRTLAAYERQEPASLRFEVIVIDDGSEDGTAEALAALRPRRYPLRFARQGNAGPAAARNRGFEKARGELVLITGDDIEPSPDLLAQHMRGHEQRGDTAAAIVGLTRWPHDVPTTATMRHVDGPGAQQFSYHYFEDGAEYDFRHFYTSNISLQRRLLDTEPGGFATAFPAAAFEDAELGHRLAYHGLRIFYRQSAVAFHHHRYLAPGFYRRQERCGRMAALLFARNPELAKWLGVPELQDRRLELLGLPPQGKRDLAHLGAVFGTLETKALRLAESYDLEGAPGLDEMLRALFHLGFVKGLAAGLWGEGAARRLAADALADRLGPAARSFRKHLRQAGWPELRADLEALCHLPELA